MTKDNSNTPVYCLDTFSEAAKTSSFYIEKLDAHLRNHSFVNTPHKHDHYLILYVTKGGGTHTIDFRTYAVKPGSFFMMTPGQVHSWKLDEGTDGYVIFFENYFYGLNVGDWSLTAFPFFHSLNADPHVENVNDKMIDSVVKEMFIEKDARLLWTYLDLLLQKLSRYYNASALPGPNQVTFRIRKLEQLIDKNFVKLKKPADYANLMNMSTAYLNNICKKQVGKTLSDLINERIVLEAKRLFAYTDLSVGQVGDRLKFSETSYFIRFFKKNVGMTPERFKELGG
ncbi:MAG TPA: AraC family transcriptional regulator [Cyclobacteriaceae bacterium]|nr:AraC family transcriptional regulator [Cyclobacteriaceae bacterium]